MPDKLDLPDELRQEICERLFQYEPATAMGLVMYTLLKWGHQLWKAGKIDNWKLIPDMFNHYLNDLYSERPPDGRQSGNMAYSESKLESEGARWAETLSQYPYQETVRVFTLAVNDWLVLCDFRGSSLYEQGGSNQEAANLARWYWYNVLGF